MREARDLASCAAFRDRAFACSLAQSFDCRFVCGLSLGEVLALDCVQRLLENAAGCATDDGVASLAFLSLGSALRRFTCICHDGPFKHRRLKSCRFARCHTEILTDFQALSTESGALPLRFSIFYTERT